MKPYSQRGMGIPHMIAKYRISRNMRVVENAFGNLSSRFSLVQLVVQPNRVKDIEFACVGQHVEG